MYAVIRTGGKQYRVEEGSQLLVERLPAAAGDTVQFDDVLLVGEGERVTIGTPRVAGASVAARVLEQTRGPKIRIIKHKRRKHHMKRQGHRQDLTRVQVTSITSGA